jgi:hypothetical protein
VIGDLTDYDAVRAAAVGCDAIVHLGALPSPLYDPGHVVYNGNTAGTFNVFEAADRLGIGRVVQASSINAIGCTWNTIDFAPRYFPVDEDHPRETTDPYSLSKQVGEDLGAYYWRRSRIGSVAFRFPWVYQIGEPSSPNYTRRMSEMRAFLLSFFALPAAEQTQHLDQARAHTLRFRAERGMEFPRTVPNLPAAPTLDDYLWYAYALDRFNLWVNLDVRDAARSINMALTAAYDGAHPLFVCNAENFVGVETMQLARTFFPQVTTFTRELPGKAALFNTERAQQLIGFTPLYQP